jgi:Na+/melibiose symporter-like transporter
MTEPAPDTADASTTSDAPRITAAERKTILLYAGVMIVVLSFINPSTGLFIIPLSFVLKNKLHLSANDLAVFGLWAAIPGYLSFVFGIVRDFWNPFGRGDRGYFILFGAIAALLLTGLAFIDVSEPMLLACATVMGISFLFLWGAWNGLASSIGQQHAMSGQMSAIWNFAGTSSIVAALFAGGALSEVLEIQSANIAVRVLFLIAALLMAAIAALGLWKPRAVFADLDGRREQRRDFFADIVRLAKHWPIYPALAAWLLWNFSPGTSTVLQYYMSNVLHASDAQWGAYNAISFAFSVPMFALFGYLSRKYSLSKLLWWGTLIGVPQMIPLLFVHSANGVLIAAVGVGLLGGIATAAYMDLLIRACPRGLEGTMMMLSWSMYALAVNVGNFWGTDIYQYHGGFVACVVATTIVYALIIPVILLVPKHLISSADAEVVAD